MRLVTKVMLLGAGWLVSLGAGCVSQEEFDALKKDLNRWAGDNPQSQATPEYLSVKEWQVWTLNVICDIMKKNTPDNGSYTPGPGGTVAYCEPGGGGGDPNGTPEDPPDFGN